MSKAIDEMRTHFNQRPVPWGSKVLMEERENVNAMIDAIEEENKQLQTENDKLRELVKDIDEVADPFLWEFIGRRMEALGIKASK